MSERFGTTKIVLLGIAIPLILLLMTELVMTTIGTGLRDGLLITACGDGNTARARFLINFLFTDATKADKVGQPPLFFAVSSGSIETAALLIEHGAKVNVAGPCGITPLHDACMYEMEEHPDIVQLLIESGANVNTKSTKGATALHCAVAYNHLETVKILLSKGADVNTRVRDGSTPLIGACRRGRLDVARLLIEHGANVNIVNKMKCTPLSYAASSESPELVALLIANGADIHGAAGNTEEPIHNAASVGIAMILVQHGADVNVVDRYGNLPIHHAAQAGKADLVEYLIASKSKINVLNRWNPAFTHQATRLTPLLLACAYEHKDVVKILLKAGADLNLKAEDQWSALHWACYKGNIGIAKLLLDHGADQTVKDKDGKTPFKLVPEKHSKQLSEFLKGYQASHGKTNTTD